LRPHRLYWSFSPFPVSLFFSPVLGLLHVPSLLPLGFPPAPEVIQLKSEGEWGSKGFQSSPSFFCFLVNRATTSPSAMLPIPPGSLVPALKNFTLRLCLCDHVVSSSFSSLFEKVVWVSLQPSPVPRPAHFCCNCTHRPNSIHFVFCARFREGKLFLAFFPFLSLASSFSSKRYQGSLFGPHLSSPPLSFAQLPAPFWRPDF